MLTRRPVNLNRANLYAPIDGSTPFMERLRVGLDASVEKLAAITNLDELEVIKLCAGGTKRDIGDNDDMHERLLEYLDGRLGSALALRRELHAMLEDSRKARIMRRDKMRGTT